MKGSINNFGILFRFFCEDGTEFDSSFVTQQSSGRVDYISTDVLAKYGELEIQSQVEPCAELAGDGDGFSDSSPASPTSATTSTKEPGNVNTDSNTNASEKTGNGGTVEATNQNSGSPDVIFTVEPHFVPTGAIIGIVVVILVLCLAAIGGFFLFKQRQRRRQPDSSAAIQSAGIDMVPDRTYDSVPKNTYDRVDEDTYEIPQSTTDVGSDGTIIHYLQTASAESVPPYETNHNEVKPKF